MELQQTDVTGCRIIGAIDRTLSHLGPKHHGVILGQSTIDQETYIAENTHNGYQVCTYTEFHNRYSRHGSGVRALLDAIQLRLETIALCLLFPLL